MIEAVALAEEFGWTLPEIRAMQGHPDPDFISAEDWEIFRLVVRKIRAHRAHSLRRRDKP